MNRFFYLLTLVLILCFPVYLDAQCAMCKEAAEASMKDNPDSMARNLNKGILYLMAMPYLAIAFIFRRQIYELYKRIAARYWKKSPKAETP